MKRIYKQLVLVFVFCFIIKISAFSLPISTNGSDREDGRPYIVSSYNLTGGYYSYVYYVGLENEPRYVMSSLLKEYIDNIDNGSPKVVAFKLKEVYVKGHENKGLSTVVSSYQLEGENETNIPDGIYFTIEKNSCVELLIQKFVLGRMSSKSLLNSNDYIDATSILSEIVETKAKDPYEPDRNELGDIIEPKSKPDTKKNKDGNRNSSKPAAKVKKKGILFTGSDAEVIELGCGQVAVNYVLGSGFGFTEALKNLHKKGIKITLIVTSTSRVNSNTLSMNPAPYNSPHFYMIDMNDSGTSQYIDSMLSSLGDYVDNYVIGNEISDQSWNYYKPCDVNTYTNAYATNFRKIYRKIKQKKNSAKLYIPFDQSWDMPMLRSSSGEGISKLKYNTKEILSILANEIGDLEWGVAAHPYPDPLSSAKFWDDVYAGHTDADGIKEPAKAFVVTMNNIEVLCNFLQNDNMRYNGTSRNVLISEIGFSGSDGEECQIAALLLAWDKIKDNQQIVGFLYNGADRNYDFGLYGDFRDAFKYLNTSKVDKYRSYIDQFVNN